MKVRELIEILSTYNPEAEIGFWASYENGVPMDDPANMIVLTDCGRWEHEEEEGCSRMEAEEVTLFVTIGLVEGDLK